MSLALSICVLIILLMQSVNGVQFLNTTCMSLFLPPVANATIVIVLLTSIHHYKHINLTLTLKF